MRRKISPDGKWATHDTPCLMEYIPTGVFYLRKRFGRKLVQQSLGTKSISEARERLPEKIVEVRRAVLGPERDLPLLPRGYDPKDELMARRPKSINLRPDGATKFSESAAVFLDLVVSDPTLKERTKNHRASIVRALLVRWSDLSTRRLDELPEEVVRGWFKEIAKEYSPSQYNALRWVFRAIVKLMRERDARLGLHVREDPTRNVKPMGTRMRDVLMPSTEEFQRLLTWLDGNNPKAAFSVRLAAYTGIRWIEGTMLRWGDVDMRQRQIRVICAKRRLAKSQQVITRYVPMIPDAYEFFRFWIDALQPLPNDFVMPARHYDHAITRACAMTQVPHMRFHDFRHYFATRCIEAGVDIPTVSRWLGHSDGGVLALRVYGHLRAQHSQAAAQLVKLQESHAYRALQATPLRESPTAGWTVVPPGNQDTQTA